LSPGRLTPGFSFAMAGSFQVVILPVKMSAEMAGVSTSESTPDRLYEIVCSTGLDAEKTALQKEFLSHFASADVQKGLEEIGYAPLPADVSAKVETAIEAIR
jgi:ABC-type phosphate transport system substrate-binding protein